jgi:hypothetical protein
MSLGTRTERRNVFLITIYQPRPAQSLFEHIHARGTKVETNQRRRNGLYLFLILVLSSQWPKSLSTAI